MEVGIVDINKFFILIYDPSKSSKQFWFLSELLNTPGMKFLHLIGEHSTDVMLGDDDINRSLGDRISNTCPPVFLDSYWDPYAIKSKVGLQDYPTLLAKSFITETKTWTLSMSIALYIEALKPPTDLWPVTPIIPASSHIDKNCSL